MRASCFRWRGPLAALGTDARRSLLARGRTAGADTELRRDTADIIAAVRAGGDRALLEMAVEFDGVALDTLEVPVERCRSALANLSPGLRRAMERSVRNIATAHAAQVPLSTEVETEPGVRVGRRADPLARVGIYAPGGRAAYPSSVLMGAVPARVAGVAEVVLCSPPGPAGAPSDLVLAAAALAGVDRVFAVGGAGAVAAMAYGTEAIPRCDRIVGPGNRWVAEAKLQVSGVVAIDSPAGPSELLVIADEQARPDVIAREVLAQAEHDPAAAVVVVVLGGDDLACRIEQAVARQLTAESRRQVIAEALEARGAVLTASGLDEALAFAEEYAAEHLLLAVVGAGSVLPRVRNAGTVFVGESSSVAFGDYMTGANHVLPTGGLARSWSGLSTLDFVRWTTWQQVEPASAARLSDDVAAFAMSEGLNAHASAAAAWRGAGADTSYGAAAEAWRGATAGAPAVAGRPGAIDLSDNTNLWGTPPAAACALRSAPSGDVARYPAVQAAGLVGALAEYLGVGPDRIVTGCGSDDVLDSAMRALGEPGDAVAYLDPPFTMIPVFARLNRLVPIGVAPAGSADVDAKALLGTGARIIYLCSPNNPTGGMLDRAVIERIVAGAPGYVILDEAYAEYCGVSAVDLTRTAPRLLVTRTMSKAFGLAGLRIGYATGAPDLVAAVAASRGPYKVNALAERAAAAALSGDLAWVGARVAEVTELRARLGCELRRAGLEPLESAANFVLVPVAGGSAVAGRMRARGVTVRCFEALPGIGDALRITVGPWPMLERCLGALAEARR